MRKLSVVSFMAAASLFVTLSASPSAFAQDAPTKNVTKIGYLSCHVASGWGFIFGSSRKLQCTYTPAEKGKKIENYSGSITKFGADIGYLQSGVILWTVLSPGVKITPNPGLLSGHYGGATASATVGLGVGGNVLVGGMDGSISLQPLSIEGNTGLNVAAGVAALTLTFQPG
jgi:Protein of unknown function (DUF992)